MIDRRVANPRLMRLCRHNWELGSFFRLPANNSNRTPLLDVQHRIGSSSVPIRVSESQGRIDEPS